MATADLPEKVLDEIEDRVYQAELRPRDFHTITLEKINDTSGRLPLGARYTYTYKSLLRWEASGRATKALTRDHPDENRLNWREIE